jgi:hypothetical protein
MIKEKLNKLNALAKELKSVNEKRKALVDALTEIDLEIIHATYAIQSEKERKAAWTLRNYAYNGRLVVDLVTGRRYDD